MKTKDNKKILNINVFLQIDRKIKIMSYTHVQTFQKKKYNRKVDERHERTTAWQNSNKLKTEL